MSIDPDSWTPEDEAVAESHYAYLEAGADQQIVVLAGRSQDGVGPAIVVIETETEDDARSFMASDPFVSSGLFRAGLHPFRVALGRRPI